MCETNNPYESPVSPWKFSATVNPLGTKQKVLLFALIVFVVTTGVLTFTWPDNWTLEVPLATVLGPWLSIRLGIGSNVVGILGLVGSLALMVPFCVRPQVATFFLLVTGLMLWSIFGFIAGLLLWS